MEIFEYLKLKKYIIKIKNIMSAYLAYSYSSKLTKNNKLK